LITCCSYKGAAEQKARSTYEYILNLVDDPDVADPIKFLREREVVHLQRFGESLRYVQEYMDSSRQFVISEPKFL
jgi:spore coat protein JC